MRFVDVFGAHRSPNTRLGRFGHLPRNCPRAGNRALSFGYFLEALDKPSGGVNPGIGHPVAGI